MILERVLRAVAVLIALLAFIDPALTLAWRERPIVGVAIVDRAGRAATATPASALDAAQAPGATSPAAAPNNTAARNAIALQSRVVAALSPDFDARPGVIPDAAAQVLIGDGRYPDDAFIPAVTAAPAPSATASTPSGRTTLVAGVLLPTASNPRIVALNAPQRAHLSRRVPITVQLEGRGLAGRTSTVILRSNALELARATHTWRQPDERATLTLDAIPFRAGLTRFTVDVINGTDAARATGSTQLTNTAPPSTPSAATPAAERPATEKPATETRPIETQGAETRVAETPTDTGDLAIDIYDHPLHVLVVSARPSWATQFIRRALEDDRRFEVAAATRVSRGVTSSTSGAPTTLATSPLDRFDAIIVGAPDLLTAAEVDTLRAFARSRGGLVVIAPDRRPEGAVLPLLPARDFTDRVLTEPEALEQGLWGSEFAAPAALLPGASVVLRAAASTAHADTSGDAPSRGSGPSTSSPGTSSGLGASNPGASSLGTSGPGASGARTSPRGTRPPIVIESPLGDGVVLLSLALDAWRFRDRSDFAFDRFWRETIAARAAETPEPVEITLSPALASPGEPVDLHVRTHTTAPAVTHTIRASLSSSPDAPSPRTSLAVASSPKAAASTGAAPAPASSPADAIPVRLWPDARPSEWRGRLNAPTGVGVYAVSVQVDRESVSHRAALLVETDVHPPQPAWRGLDTLVGTRGGVLVGADQLDRLTQHLRQSVHPVEVRRPQHPLRSVWWLLPFAACLGGEWFVRRRRGAR